LKEKIPNLWLIDSLKSVEELTLLILYFTTIPYTVSHLNYPWLNFGKGIFRCNYFVCLIIKSCFLFTWSAQPSILTKVTIMWDDYFKTNPRVIDLPCPGIELQSPSHQPFVIGMSYFSVIFLKLWSCWQQKFNPEKECTTLFLLFW